MTSQLVIAGTNSVGKCTLRCRPAQSCASVITGVTPGGLTRRDAAKDGGLMMIVVCRYQRVNSILIFLGGEIELASGGFGGRVSDVAATFYTVSH